MTHYRKVDVRIWNDEKFVSLSVHGRLAFFMLLTHPMMTALGAMRGTPGGIVEELCSGEEGLREAFREGLDQVFSKGLAEYDPKASLIALPNFLKYNPPESPNVVKAWTKSLDLIPEGNLKTLAVARAAAFVEGMSKAFREALPDAFRRTSTRAYGKTSPKTSPNQRAENREEVRYEESKYSTRTYARESFLGDIPLDPPDDEREGLAFLQREGVPAARLNDALSMLMNHRLYRSSLDQIVEGRA